MSTIFDAAPRSELREDSGRLVVHVPRPGLVVTRIEGHFSNAIARAFEEACELEMKQGGFVGLHDWTPATSFDVAVPPRLATWTVARLGSIARIVIATTHPIVSFAVRTTNLTIKRIEHLDSSAALLDVVAGEMGRDSTRPKARR